MIKGEKLSKHFSGKTIINNINFSLTTGILHISGENGSGKSTLLNMIAGSLKPDYGHILFNNNDLYSKKSKDIKSMMGYLPAQIPIYPFLTGNEFLSFICHVKKQSWPDKMLSVFKLENHLQKPFESMSYGTKKKLLFIAAVIAKPQLLILDEPLNGLDTNSANLMSEIITQHLEIDRNLCIIVTHDEYWLEQWKIRFKYELLQLTV